MLEETLENYASLCQTETQIRIYTKQIDFTLKICNYAKKYELLDLNLG